MSKLFFLSQEWSHMCSESGYANLYNGLSQLLGNKVIRINPLSLWNERDSHTGFERLRNLPFKGLSGCKAEEFFPWVDEIQQFGAVCLTGMLNDDAEAIAILAAGEDQLSQLYFTQSDSFLKRIFVVFHQPYSWFESIEFDTRLLERLGGVICLSSSQAEFFKKKCRARIIVSRHGVNHNFFVPAVTPNTESNNILFVGQWMRDYDVLERSMEYVWTEYPDANLTCIDAKSVSAGKQLLHLARDPRVRILKNVSQIMLKDIYASVSLTFLPLIDSVANNAILEAVACKSPLVVTDLPATREYLQSCDVYFAEKGNSKSHARAICECISRRKDLNPNPLRNDWHTEFVTKYDWTNISGELLREIGFNHA